MPHRFLARLGTVTGLFVLLHACGGDDRTFGTEETGGAGGAGGKAAGGGGAKPTGGSGGKTPGGAGGDSGGNGASAGTDSGGTDAGGAGAGGGAGGNDNEGGAGGEPVVDVDPGSPGSALVSGGNVMTSAKYRLVLTTGEGPGGTQVLQSRNYKLIGGLVGTTEQ